MSAFQLPSLEVAAAAAGLPLRSSLMAWACNELTALDESPLASLRD